MEWGVAAQCVGNDHLLVAMAKLIDHNWSQDKKLALVTRGDLPSRQMVRFCWFCVKLAQPLPTRQMLGKF